MPRFALRPFGAWFCGSSRDQQALKDLLIAQDHIKHALTCTNTDVVMIAVTRYVCVIKQQTSRSPGEPDMTNPSPTPKTRVFLVGAKTRLAFTFHHRTPQEIIDEMTEHDWIKPATEDDPYYVPGLFRFTREGACAGNGHT